MIRALYGLPRLRGRALLIALCEKIVENFEKERIAYYVTDALFLINQNTSHEDSSHMSKRYIYMAHPEWEDNRSGDEIAIEVIKNAGLRFEQ